MYIIPTVHPAALLRGERPIIDAITADLGKANRVSMYDHSQVENHVIVHPSNPSGLEATVREARAWIARWRSLRCPVAIDVESSSLYYWRCKLYSIGLCGCDGYFTGVAFTLADLHTLPPEAERVMAEDLRQLLLDPDVENLFHNGPYDMPVLRKKGFDIVGPIMDTLSLDHLIQPDVPHDLGWIGHQWLDVEPWKLNHEGRKQAFTKDIIELLVYNNKDAINTAKLRNPLLQEVYDRGMDQRLVAFQMSLVWLATQMELAGIPVNKDKWIAQGQALWSRCEFLRYRMRNYLGWPDFNPDSHDQLREAIYSARFAGSPWNLGLQAKALTEKTNRPATSYDALVHYIQHPFVRDAVEYTEKRSAWGNRYKTAEAAARIESAKKGKYVAPKWADNSEFHKVYEDDGRFHLQWKPHEKMKGTRLATAPNFQNVPEDERWIFEALEGRVFVGADKDQLELRIAACLAGAGDLLAVMRDPKSDPHRWICRQIYDDFDTYSPEDQQRTRNGTKNVEYASLYRAGVDTVHNTILTNKKIPYAVRAGLDRDTVSHIYYALFAPGKGPFHPLSIYHDRNYALAKQLGYLEIPPFGRRRCFPQEIPPYTECANWPIQSTAGEIVADEGVRIQLELLRRYHGTAYIILHLHDALYVECNERDAEDIRDLVNELFGRTILEGPAGPVYLTAKAKISKSLAMEEYRLAA